MCQTKKDTPFDKIQPMLFKNNIRLMDTSKFFLKEFRNNHYYRVSVSKANEDEIRAGIPKLIRILGRYN